MTEFASLLDGLRYVESCPLCKNFIPLAGAGSNIEAITYDYRGNANITVSIDRHRVEIELLTGLITGIVEEKIEDEIIGSPMTMAISRPTFPLPTSGLYYIPIHRHCDNCNKYHMTLQVQLDMGLKMIHKILLNSEHIHFTNKDRLFEITNSYVMDKTEFAEALAIANKIELPLIPLDHNNVGAYITRVKNLLIFI